MRNNVRLGVVLAAAYLTGTAGLAYGQAAGRNTGAATGTSIATGVGNAAGVQAAPAVPVQTPSTGTLVTTPANVAQPAIGAPGATQYNAATGAPTAAGMVPGQSVVNQTPGSAGTGALTPGYTNRAMPGMTGYNSVNPMATTMAPGYYYAGTAGMPYATRGYNSMYVTPGNYYVTQPGTYPVRQRRGLLGGLFRRRNRVAYPATTYGTTPYGYTTYGTTTYTAPTTYTYTTAPY